ncbi:hypothetical protein P691DRAFT_778179 [Macrolepiota fuliginosa MF-IS2]|uniref:G domain-containing protein n=1 Tax=Macrolepiota fuliginosa MF-IS2 TaxID=1400762 RepID=A0A9P6C0F4_9AGAR|nr:hypothetical protein P691DRAFT_778179 [Macrolepiota fuliginosa MF-IS2]
MDFFRLGSSPKSSRPSPDDGDGYRRNAPVKDTEADNKPLRESRSETEHHRAKSDRVEHGPSSRPEETPQPRAHRSHAPDSTSTHQAPAKRARTRRAPQVPLFRQVQNSAPKNIVIFGETGTGKSSLINMLSDDSVATVSNSALGCTFESASYPVTIHGKDYVLWDTAGLNEGEAGSIPAGEALHHLRDLVDKLKDGLSLLVYCIRGARYRDIIKVNHDLFKEIICQGEVPIVIVVTGLENEENMEDWWVENEKEYTGPPRNMRFEGHACITTSKGKKNMFEEEYEESKKVVRALIRDKCPEGAWAVDSDVWFRRITDRIQDYYDDYNGHPRTTTVRARDEDQGPSTSLYAMFRGFVSLLTERFPPRRS